MFKFKLIENKSMSEETRP